MEEIGQVLQRSRLLGYEMMKIETGDYYYISALNAA